MCSKIAKYLLFTFNIVFWIFGGVALGLGIYFRVEDDVNNVVQVADVTFYYAGCYIMIGVGSVMFVVGFLGCCGAIKESRCLLGLYFVCILLIFIAELGVGIWVLVNQDTITRDIQKHLNDSVPLKYSDDDAYIQSVIAVERRFKCCGVSSGCQDWAGGNTYGCSCDVSDSDCATVSGCRKADSGEGTGVYTKSCYTAIEKAVNDNITLVAGIAIGIGVLELFGMIAVGIVCNESKKKQYASY